LKKAREKRKRVTSSQAVAQIILVGVLGLIYKYGKDNK
jgi:hypothetical protein